MNSFLCFAEQSFAPFSHLFVHFFSLVATASKCQFTLVSWFSFVLCLKTHCSFGVWLVSNCCLCHSYAPFAKDLDIIPFCFGALQRRCTSTMHVDLFNVARKKHNKWRKKQQQQQRQQQRNWNEFATFMLKSSLSFAFHCPCYFSPHYFWEKSIKRSYNCVFHVGDFATDRESRRTSELYAQFSFFHSIYVSLHLALDKVCQVLSSFSPV